MPAARCIRPLLADRIKAGCHMGGDVPLLRISRRLRCDHDAVRRTLQIYAGDDDFVGHCGFYTLTAADTRVGQAHSRQAPTMVILRPSRCRPAFDSPRFRPLRPAFRLLEAYVLCRARRPACDQSKI